MEGVTHVFFDCDDCLYQNDWATAKKITESIGKYTSQELGISQAKAYELYKDHGTCLKGLLAEGIIDEAGAEAFLHEVHLINYDDIARDEAMRAAVEGVSAARYRRWVFTASTVEHATRCLERVGVADLFQGVIDTRTCKLETKHAAASFDAAMAAAGAAAAKPAACLLLDDSVKNIAAAKAHGWRTVLVGKKDRDTGNPIVCDAADVHVESLHELREACPELYAA
jgi:putative hydrolase of the HAD superfamily/pyrimidine and pyridine-specific 5'-nucleotidase